MAEKTGLSFEEARLAIMEKMNDGYAIGDPKRRGANELASIKAYLDTNLDYSATDAIMFLEDIEEIAFSGSIDLASDTAKNVSKQNAKQIIDSSLPGDEFGETLIDFDSAPKTLEDTFENVPPDRRSVMEEMYAPIIEEQKIIEATQKEIQQTAAKIQDLIEQGRVDEAEALAESLKDFQTQLKSTDSALDATIIPPNRTLNAKGGRIGFALGDGVGFGSDNYNPATTLPQNKGQTEIYRAYMDQLPADNPARQRYFSTGNPTLPHPTPTPTPDPEPTPTDRYGNDYQYLLDDGMDYQELKDNYKNSSFGPPPWTIDDYLNGSITFTPGEEFHPVLGMTTMHEINSFNDYISSLQNPRPGQPSPKPISGPRPTPKPVPNEPYYPTPEPTPTPSPEPSPTPTPIIGLFPPGYRPPFTTGPDFNPANPRPIPRGGVAQQTQQSQPGSYETESDFKQGGRVGIGSLFKRK